MSHRVAERQSSAWDEVIDPEFSTLSDFSLQLIELVWITHPMLTYPLYEQQFECIHFKVI